MCLRLQPYVLEAATPRSSQLSWIPSPGEQASHLFTCASDPVETSYKRFAFPATTAAATAAAAAIVGVFVVGVAAGVAAGAMRGVAWVGADGETLRHRIRGQHREGLLQYLGTYGDRIGTYGDRSRPFRYLGLAWVCLVRAWVSRVRVRSRDRVRVRGQKEGVGEGQGQREEARGQGPGARGQGQGPGPGARAWAGAAHRAESREETARDGGQQRRRAVAHEAQRVAKRGAARLAVGTPVRVGQHQPLPALQPHVPGLQPHMPGLQPHVPGLQPHVPGLPTLGCSPRLRAGWTHASWAPPSTM